MERFSLTPTQADDLRDFIEEHQPLLDAKSPHRVRLCIDPEPRLPGDVTDRFRLIVLEGGIRLYEEVI